MKSTTKYINKPNENNIAEVEITFPNKSTIQSTQDDINQVLSLAFVSKLQLTSLVPKKVQLEECFADKQHGNFHINRFRPNIVIDLNSGIIGFIKDDSTLTSMKC